MTSEINRPSGSELAQQQARAKDASKRKTQAKQMDKAAGQHAAGKQGQQQVQGQGKKLKSAFDNVLDSLADQATPMALPESKFDSKLKEIQRDDDRSAGDRDGEDEDNKTKDKSEKSESSRETASGSKRRIGAKHGLKDRGSGSGGDKEGQKGSQDKSAASNLLKRQMVKPEPMPAPSPMGPAGPANLTPEVQSAQAARELPKALLDQIIQSVTIIKGKDLKKEMHIDFNDNFFNGLKLKVVSQNGEVSIEFLVPNRSVQDTFNNEKEKIAAALGEKDIDVRSIDITLL